MDESRSREAAPVAIGPDGLPRPAHPSLAELRAVCQPPAVRSRKNAEHWTAELYLRHVSIYLTRVLVMTPLSANQVTAIMIVIGWSMSAALLIPSWWGPLLAVFLSQLQLYVDCCDGEVARWRGVTGPKGVFLDIVGHYSTEALFAIAFGYRCAAQVSGTHAVRHLGGHGWALCWAGSTLAVLLVLNRAQSLMVQFARGKVGMPQLPDTAEARAVPPTTLIGKLRRLARFAPFHRLLHAVELSLLLLAASIVAQAPGAGSAERVLLWVLLCAALFVNVGHFLANVASARLAPPQQARP
jgi:phosphatidylglycerophosphate synthase